MLKRRLRPRLFIGVCATLVSAAISFLYSAAGAEPGKLRYNESIRPILSNNCFQCHGPDEKKREAELRLDTFEGATHDLGGYAALKPGAPEKSALLARILSHDRDEMMPPPKSKKPSISPNEVALLRRWITEGAQYEGHWAFQPLSQEPPPVVAKTSWAKNSIDQFILSELEKRELLPSPEAPKAVLLRRLALDLTGLPPTPAEALAFENDSRPNAYERAVERLLASPHYGERWGRHWLDQARYADSDGYSIDAARDMWPFRDWVIRALNEDMPFDQFTIEQVAGDLLPSASKLQSVASAFHRNTMVNQEGGTNPEQFRDETVVDRTNTTGAVWLGLTVGCAQCHSHKYDPISHQEYYKLFAFFNSSTDINSRGQTLEVLPGEILGPLNTRVTPVQFDHAKARVATAQGDAAKRQSAWFEKLKAAGEASTPWQSVYLENFATESGRDHAILPDGVIQLSNAGKAKDVFTVFFSTKLERMEAVQLRVLPQSSKGKIAAFTLGEFELLLDGVPQPLAVAQSASESAKNPPKAAIDGNSTTTWIAEPNSAKDDAYEIWFAPEATIYPSGHTLSVRIRQEGSVAFDGAIQLSASQALPLLPADSKLAAAARKAAASGMPLPSAQQTALRNAFSPIDLVQTAAESALERLRKAAKPATLMVMKELPEPRQTFLHMRGDFLSPDQALGALQPNTPAILPPLQKSKDKVSRLELARWLVRADNPLTPRVTVNRIWMRYFGLGLVETENDFGTQGTSPTHPALLDWLSSEFIRKKWSMKELHKLIVTSATYRQSSNARTDLSERDPRNLWLARQNRVRLDAEIVRDTALAASGLLDLTLGGAPVFPPQPAGVYAFTQNSKPWVTSKGAERYRRALYTQFYRSAQHPLTSTFDAPNFSTTCTRRLRSNTPLQALMLANDETFYEMAQATARQLWKDEAQLGEQADANRIRLAFQRFYSRSATQKELEKSLRFLETCRHQVKAEPAVEVAPNPAFAIPNQSPGETAAWTALARGLMNTDEFITRE